MTTELERLATVEARLLAAAEERARTSRDIEKIETTLDTVKTDVGEIKVDIATAKTNQTWEIEALKRIESKVEGLGHHSEISGHQHIMHNGHVQKVAVLGGGGLGGMTAIIWGMGRALGWW